MASLPRRARNGRLAPTSRADTTLRFVTLLKPIAVPLAILLVAAVIAVAGAGSATSTLRYGPYVLLMIAAVIALWFNRGRVFFILVSLLLAYAGLRMAAEAGPFAARATFTAAAVFVPLNILIALLARERGVFHFRSYRWLLMLAVEAMLTAWIAGAEPSTASNTRSLLPNAPGSLASG